MENTLDGVRRRMMALDRIDFLLQIWMNSSDPTREKGSSFWTFANAQLDERTLELTVDGQVVELERKPLEVLRFFLANAGKVLTHEEILAAVWPGRILTESVLKKCISRLREVLQDDARFTIKTIHGYGYRLLAPVTLSQPKSTVILAPENATEQAAIRQCAVLLVDIAGTVALRSQLGDAAAGRRISTLLETVIASARAHGGEFIKSYGDDVLAVFEEDPINSAGRVAIESNRAAIESGLQIYAGFHFGEVEFRDTMGHPDVTGLTVNIAARLHKLTEGAPGRIFFAEESLDLLAPDLRRRANAYGQRDLKGIGPVSVWTLEWDDSQVTSGTVFTSGPFAGDARIPSVFLSHGSSRVELSGEMKSGAVGRGKTGVLRVVDPVPKISSTHLLFEFGNGHWLVQDISRNGTWLRDKRTGETFALPSCKQILLPRAGVLCLGRSFEEDADERFQISFSVSDPGPPTET